MYSLIDFALQVFILCVVAYIVILILRWMAFDPIAEKILKIVVGTVLIVMIVSFFFWYDSWPHLYHGPHTVIDR